MCSYIEILLISGFSALVSLTVSFTSGLQIKIPESQLIVPDYYVDQNGQSTIYNSSESVIRLGPNIDVNAGDMPVLGQTFLSSAFLLVDYDLNRFTVGQSNPTAPSRLMAIESGLPCSIGTDGNPTGATATPTLSPTANPKKTHHSTAIGAVVGGVLGGVAFLSLLSLLFVIFRKRHQNKLHQGTNKQDIQAQREREPYYSAPVEMHEETVVNETGGHFQRHELPIRRLVSFHSNFPAK